MNVPNALNESIYFSMQEPTKSTKNYKITDNIDYIKTLLPEDAIKERSFDLNKLFEIAMVRESPHPQFDGMSYMKYNETNEMADISFLAPKINKQDSRITTGITHEKDSSLVSFFINMNFEGTVRVFKKDKELYDVGVALTNWVRKSREEEDYNEKRPYFYRNYVAQGTAFSLEEDIERYVPNKVLTSEVDFTQLDKVTWKEAGLKKVYQGCESTLIDGKKVFMEYIRQPDIQKQPGVYLVDYIPRAYLEGIWGKTDRWKMVPDDYTQLQQWFTAGSIYSDWILAPIDADKCCVIRAYRPFERRFQIYINTVPMLPTGFPLQPVSPGEVVPLAKGDSDLMNMFAYSKSEPAKTKIDQAVYDKVLQNMLVKFQQSAFVPRGNLSDKILDSSILMGGRMISDLDPKDIPPLIDNPGVTQSDFSFFNLLREQIDSKSISALLEGNPVPGDMTLGQYMDMQKKQMLKLGMKLDGIISWERQMLKLRTFNLIANGAKKREDSTYEDVSMEAEISSGGKGISILKFDEDNRRTSEDVFNEQNQYQEENGVEADIIYLNPQLLKEIITDPEYKIFFEIVPVDKNNDKLAQIMYVQMITQAAQLFGMDSLQVAKLKKRYAAKMGEQFDDLFLDEQQLELKQMEMQQAMVAEEAAGGKKKAPVPSPMGNEMGMKEMAIK